MKISPLIGALLLCSCATNKHATVTQPCATFTEDQSDLSIRTSIVAVSGVPNPNSDCAGTQLFTSAGTSLTGGAVAVGQAIAAVTPRMALAPMKGIFNTDDWAESLVKKMDGSIFSIAVPGLAQPIIVQYHAPISTESAVR